jgi:hypothetical protein
MHGFAPDDDRLAELILYISGSCADWDEFDPVVLTRILFQSDFAHYREYGAPISGQTYRRGPSGPVPRGLSRVLRGLAREFAILEIPLGDGLHVKRRPAAMREARLALFAEEELATVEEVMRHYRSTWTPSRESPDFLDLDWEAAGPREIIPYSLALASPVGIGPGAPRY